MYYIISNPISGRKKNNQKKVQQIFDYLDENKIEYVRYESQYYRHPVEIAKRITSEHESGKIIVIGGDGTFNEVLNGISDFSKWQIGLIPAGSGNDFAACLNIPTNDYIGALKLILNENVVKTDYIKINDQVCCNVLGTGIDVEVLINFEKHTKLKGSFRYFISLLEALFHIRWHEFDVSIDGGEFVHKKGFLITLCNGCHFGGGIPICPGADPIDGKMEFVFVNEIEKHRILGYLIRLMKGKVFTFEETEHIYCEKAIFKDDKKLLLQIDGNITDNYNEYRCEIVHEGLNMYR